MRYEGQQPGSESKIEAYFKNLQISIDHLGGLFYRGDLASWKKEMGGLAEMTISVLGSESDLDGMATNKKYFQIWKKVADILYKGIHKPESEEVFEKVSSALALVCKFADSETNRGPGDAIIKNLFDTWPWSDLKQRPKKSKKSDRNEAVLKKYFAQFGLDAEIVFKAWYASHEENHPVGKLFDRHFSHPVDTAMTNMMEMRRLELKYPGGPKSLIDNFGLYSFSRYPEGMLDDQLEQIDDVVNQYGIVIVARSDHSGFDYKPESIESIKTLWEQCKAQGINLRVIEVGSQRDMRKKFFFLENKYNIPGNQKAVFGIANVHGNDSLVALGNDDTTLSYVSSQDVQSGNFAEDSKRFFSEGAYFVIGGCDTGAEGGLAEKSAKVMPNLHILASSEGVSSLSYRITKLEGERIPRISVKYKTGRLFAKEGEMKHY